MTTKKEFFNFGPNLYHCEAQNQCYLIITRILQSSECLCRHCCFALGRYLCMMFWGFFHGVNAFHCYRRWEQIVFQSLLLTFLTEFLRLGDDSDWWSVQIIPKFRSWICDLPGEDFPRLCLRNWHTEESLEACPHSLHSLLLILRTTQICKIMNFQRSFFFMTFFHEGNDVFTLFLKNFIIRA